MSSRQKRKIARTNGAKSAGTKSPEGLQISSQNALRHGLTAKTLVLSNESQSKFDELLDSFIQKFQPQDGVELELVVEMVAARWRLRRIWLIQTTALEYQMDRMEEELSGKFSLLTEPTRLSLAFTTMANQEKSLQLLLRYESAYRRMYNQAQRDLLKLRESKSCKEIPNEAKPRRKTGPANPNPDPKATKTTEPNPTKPVQTAHKPRKGHQSRMTAAANHSSAQPTKPKYRPHCPLSYNEAMPSTEIEALSPATIARYEPVIGLEVHVQLATHTKIYCGCPTSFGAPPNANVCPVCLGLPGALPVLSKPAVEMAIKASLALNCQVRTVSRMARKNYFYPDLPKGYQISQYDQPLAEHGYIDVIVNDQPKRIGVTRVHMEDDAGKSIHDGFKDSDRYSYVDLNRSGTPLIEIVSEPDIRSADEAYAYLTELKQRMQFVDVSDCDMEKGQLRCDANVSVRLKGAPKFGTKAEVKNLNSFRHVKLGIEYEILRQIALIESGGRVVQESRSFHVESGETISMRSKEDAHDYRYFPEPDLVPLHVSDAWRERVHAEMPELPAAMRARFTQSYGLREYDAQVLTSTRASSEYFERALKVSGDPRATANWVMGDLAAALKAEDKDFSEATVTPESLGELIALITKGEISGKLAKDIFARMLTTGDAPRAIMDREGLAQISDTSALDKIIDEVLAANTKQVEQYKSGKTTVIGFLVGQVMKASRGQANPGVLNEMLKAKLQ